MGIVTEINRFKNFREFNEFLYNLNFNSDDASDLYLFTGVVVCPGAEPTHVVVPYSILQNLASAAFQAGYHISLHEILDGYKELEFSAVEA